VLGEEDKSGSQDNGRTALGFQRRRRRSSQVREGAPMAMAVAGGRRGRRRLRAC
jgi:hypothetical protein